MSGLIEVLEQARRIAESEVEADAICTPELVAGLVMADMAELEQEELWVLLLNRRNNLMRMAKVYKGTIDSNVVRIAEVYKDAIRENAAAIVVVHNHPSGNPSPSPEDIAVTGEMAKAGELLGVELLDHLVIASGGYTSIRQSQGLDW